MLLLYLYTDNKGNDIEYLVQSVLKWQIGQYLRVVPSQNESTAQWLNKRHAVDHKCGHQNIIASNWIGANTNC